MKPARILLIVVALLAGGMAAFLATRGSAPASRQQAAEPVQIRQEPRTRVLVATSAIGLGQRLTTSNVTWQDWPQGAVRAEYITADAVPDAPEQVAGAVARFEFFPGEPIRQAKLVNADQGYLSAVITKGMRAVSVSVGAASASGGYIVPNDRVDVVLTRGGSSFSETILQNVRVLAIGNRLGEVGTTADPTDPQEPTSQVWDGAKIATLEVSPLQAETVLNANSQGALALVLRSVVDFTQRPEEMPRTQPIQVIGFGQTRAIISGTAPGEAPAIDPETAISALDRPGTPPIAGTQPAQAN